MTEKTELSHTCCICGMPLSLEDCKVDEQGRAIHPSCYWAALASEKRDESDSAS